MMRDTDGIYQILYVYLAKIHCKSYRYPEFAESLGPATTPGYLKIRTWHLITLQMARHLLSSLVLSNLILACRCAIYENFSDLPRLTAGFDFIVLGGELRRC